MLLDSNSLVHTYDASGLIEVMTLRLPHAVNISGPK